MKRFLHVAVLVFGAILPATCPAGPLNKKAVQQAIDRGVDNLKTQQFHNGVWESYCPESGSVALAGLTLLECGVSPSAPAIQKAAEMVRSSSIHLNHTYSLALAILFLDRLGEPLDAALIESMTVRLLGGQLPDGCWIYHCPGLSGGEFRQLSRVLEQKNELVAGKPGKLPGSGPTEGHQLPPEIRNQIEEQVERQRAYLRNWDSKAGPGGDNSNTQLAPPTRSQSRPPGNGPLVGDNSNTQFALLALWVARRYGLPVENALAEVEQHFRQTQNFDGGWGYMGNPAFSRSTPSMTCAGLLGLATGYGASLRTVPGGKSLPRPGAGRARDLDLSRDPAIRRALMVLSTAVGQPTGIPAKARPQLQFANGGKVFYYLWSLERVAAVFGLDTIGGKDWYGWGAECLLATQADDGSWTIGEFPQGGVDTCFALLFLKRSNLAPDLTRILRTYQVKDPGRVEPSTRGFGPLDPSKSSKPPTDPPGVKPRKPPPSPGAGVESPTKTPTTRNPPPLVGSGAEEEASQMGKVLVSGAGPKLDQVLTRLREGKGSAFTEALAQAIPNLEGDVRKKARRVLAERMARMNAETLGNKLRDQDPEVRRATCLACAMREETTHFARLIDLLQDPEPLVARAARAALKSLSGQDFGPEEDATQAERTTALEKWKNWWKNNEKK